jgi:hypothetical protein
MSHEVQFCDLRQVEIFCMCIEGLTLIPDGIEIKKEMEQMWKKKKEKSER